MAVAFDGSIVPNKLDPLPCGGTPYFDSESGMSYRCSSCFAVVGSIGMPLHCKQLYQEEQDRQAVIEAMGFLKEENDENDSW